ncbi:MAG: hypothetical protein LBN98_02535 [Prevotellaceae bacterium]|jgi:hypothetical protein|nr:hypothetical protein [Prevotellaceae bacterium]
MNDELLAPARLPVRATISIEKEKAQAGFARPVAREGNHINRKTASFLFRFPGGDEQRAPK